MSASGLEPVSGVAFRGAESTSRVPQSAYPTPTATDGSPNNGPPHGPPKEGPAKPSSSNGAFIGYLQAMVARAFASDPPPSARAAALLNKGISSPSWAVFQAWIQMPGTQAQTLQPQSTPMPPNAVSPAQSAYRAQSGDL